MSKFKQHTLKPNPKKVSIKAQNKTKERVWIHIKGIKLKLIKSSLSNVFWSLPSSSRVQLKFKSSVKVQLKWKKLIQAWQKLEKAVSLPPSIISKAFQLKFNMERLL
jgi:hypothetical protein